MQTVQINPGHMVILLINTKMIVFEMGFHSTYHVRLEFTLYPRPLSVLLWCSCKVLGLQEWDTTPSAQHHKSTKYTDNTQNYRYIKCSIMIISIFTYCYWFRKSSSHFVYIRCHPDSRYGTTITCLPPLYFLLIPKLKSLKHQYIFIIWMQ